MYLFIYFYKFHWRVSQCNWPFDKIAVRGGEPTEVVYVRETSMEKVTDFSEMFINIISSQMDEIGRD